MILCIYSGGNKFYLSMFYCILIIYWSVCIVNPTYARSLMSKNKTDTLTKYQIVMNRVLGIIWIIISIHWLRLLN
ncbi:protein of unknown function [Tepidibacter aestuarii]|nr:protein of unknown function [Tepidibacter aestuarii]